MRSEGNQGDVLIPLESDPKRNSMGTDAAPRGRIKEAE